MRTTLTLFALCLSSRLFALIITVSVGGSGNFFQPAAFTINPGDTVRWVWVNGHHNASGYSLPTGASPFYGNVTSVDTIYEYVASVSGLYKYTCTHHSGMDGEFFVSGCTFPSKPVISGSPSAGCIGDTVILVASAQHGASYQWMNGIYSIPFANSISLKATASGSYKVVVNRCGMDAVPDPFPVMIHNPPSAAFTYTSNGLHYLFQSVPGADSYIWKFSDGSPDQHAPQANISFANPGTYTIQLKTLNTTTTCTDSSSQVIVAGTATNMIVTETPKIALYPNPAAEMFFVKCKDLKSIRITDMLGRRYPVQVETGPDACKVYTNQIPNGRYNIKLYQENQNYQVPLTIQH